MPIENAANRAVTTILKKKDVSGANSIRGCVRKPWTGWEVGDVLTVGVMYSPCWKSIILTAVAD